MPQMIQRRDFLKLLSLLPAAYYLPKTTLAPSQVNAEKNILILIFDSWTTANSSLYGYPRETTPNITKWAEQAIVYHNHYANGHYTYPSTASLLTGVLPWIHKGYWPGPEKLLTVFFKKNLFSLFDTHFRSAYTNNSLAESILKRMSSFLELFPPRHELALQNQPWFETLFESDQDIYDVSWIRGMDKRDDGYAYSLFASNIYEIIRNRSEQKLTANYPRGIPLMVGNYNFLLETVIDWTITQIYTQPKPFLSYFHLLPPHEPYTTRVDFFNRFQNDGFKPITKPPHPLRSQSQTLESQLYLRRSYDEYLLFVDSEFGRFMKEMQASGQLENTIVILTSDHGEMFERGIPFHMTPSFHKPQMHIPLLIFLPYQEERIDIHALTNTVDILPTLLYLNQKPLPDWLEGEVLPPFKLENQPDRVIFGADFRHNPKEGPYNNGTVMMRKGDYKLTYLFGSEDIYENLNGTLYELYNVKEDPEELENLYQSQPELANSLIQELKDKMREVGVLDG